jgi:hypothetical protein
MLTQSVSIGPLVMVQNILFQELSSLQPDTSIGCTHQGHVVFQLSRGLLL